MTNKDTMNSTDFQIVVQCLIMVDGDNKPTTKRNIPVTLHTLRIPNSD